MDHWKAAVPNFKPPSYVPKITDENTVYAYLPVEQIRNHVNDPDAHYHLAGKDAIHMMTQKVRTNFLTARHEPYPYDRISDSDECRRCALVARRAMSLRDPISFVSPFTFLCRRPSFSKIRTRSALAWSKRPIPWAAKESLSS